MLDELLVVVLFTSPFGALLGLEPAMELVVGCGVEGDVGVALSHY